MKFQVKGLRESDDVVSVLLDATDALDAERQARAGGLAVLSLHRATSARPALFKKRVRFPLALFVQELFSLLEAGLTLVEAIEGLAEKEATGPTKATLDHILRQLHEGRPLSHAMEDLPLAFPDLFVATVRATERTGDLPNALQRYIAYHAQLEFVRKKVVSASIYPLVLLGVGALVLLFLLGYVVPKFSHVYEDMHSGLPFLSRVLLDVGRFIESNTLTVAVSLVAIAMAVVRVLTLAGTRNWIGGLLWAIPAVGERMRLYQLARFYRTLGMLLRGGTPAVTALDMSAGLLSPVLRGSLAAAAQSIREGRSISDAMSAYNLTTPVALRMLRVGERSGRMDEMVDRIATFCDEEISRWVDWLTRLFEPLLMACIGIVIGVIVVLMYMPIFELAGNIQ
jgi:general secretion pathway protein F